MSIICRACYLIFKSRGAGVYWLHQCPRCSNFTRMNPPVPPKYDHHVAPKK